MRGSLQAKVEDCIVIAICRKRDEMEFSGRRGGEVKCVRLGGITLKRPEKVHQKC